MAEEDPSREPPHPDGAATPGDDADEDEDRAAILARRRALVRRSIASIGAVVVSGLVTDCASVVGPNDGGDATVDAQPQACLRFAPDTSPQPCLGAPAPDVTPVPTDVGGADMGSPKPCLDIAVDAGPDPDR